MKVERGLGVIPLIAHHHHPHVVLTRSFPWFSASCPNVSLSCWLLIVIHGPRPSSIILLFPIPTYFSHFKMKFIIIMIIINSVTTSFSYSLLPPFFFLLNLADLNGAIKNFVDLFYHREFCSLINIRLCLILSKFMKKFVRNKH